MIAPRRVLRELISSYWLRVGASTFFIMAFFQWVPYITTGVWVDFTPLWRFNLLFVPGGAILELWLKSDSAKAIMAPIAARMEPLAARIEKSWIWRFNSSLIAKSVTFSVFVIMLMVAAVMAAMMAVIACLYAGVSHRVIDGVLGLWPFYAFIAGYGVLWLIFYHAGIDPWRAIDRLFLWGGIGTIGFVAGNVWAHYPELSSQQQPGAQRDFHKAIMSAQAPCVAVQGNLSDLSACTVFGLRPGMAQSEALGIVNGSGYLRNSEKPAVCAPADKCSHYVSFIKDGLYLRVEFNSYPKSAAPDEHVSSIVLSMNEGANPYFDENQMMVAFLKLIGPNGTPIGTEHMLWTDIKNTLELRAYTHEHAFWAVFSSRLDDRPNTPGVPV